MMQGTHRAGALALLVLVSTPAGARAQAEGEVVEGRGAPTVPLPRLEGDVAIDARLDEPVWQDAVRLGGFWQYEPVDGTPAAERTEVLAWYSAEAVHFAILAYDSRPSSIRATRQERDNIDGEDNVVLYLDTFDDQRRAFLFGVNPLGVQADGVRTEAGFGGTEDDSPDYVWESAGRITDEGWVAEVRIPFQSLTLPSSEPQRWGFQATRQLLRAGHTYTWTDARQASASFLAQSGGLSGIAGFERNIRLEAQPFVTARSDRRLDEGSGRFGGDGIEPDAGLNLHAGFGAHALDLTVNPDFSQVEADAAQVTANERFALFYPEKRPFFLEGIELFATPGELVYTRRIADPIVGVKMTGKIGPIGYAAISALDEGLDSLPNAVFNIARLRTDFGRSSLAGLTFTDRSEVGAGTLLGRGRASVPRGYNRVVSGDVRHVFGGIYYVETQLAGSWTGGEAFDTRAGEMWRLTWDRTGHYFGFNYGIEGVSDAFEAHSGFVSRNGYVSARALNRLRYYGDPGDVLEVANLILHPSRLWRYRGDDGFFGGGIGDPIEGGESLELSARLRGGWQIDFAPGRDFVLFDADDFLELEVEDDGGVASAYRPLPEFSGFGYGFEVATPVFRTWQADVGVGYGAVPIYAEGAEGRAFEAEAGFELRPTSWLRAAADVEWQRLVRDRDDSEFATAFIPRIQTEVQPTRALFFRAIGEWSSEERAALVDARTGRPLLRDGVPVPAFAGDQLRLDLLAAYEPTPGTVAFLGYGTTFGEGDDFDYRQRELLRREDGFFVKVSYRFRW